MFFVSEVKNKIKSSQHATNELLEEFNPECLLQQGQKLEGITDLFKFSYDSHQTNTLKMEEGKSTLIYLWSVHSILSKKHLKYLNESFEKNQRSWEAHLRIILINIDCYRDKEKAIEFFKQLKITKLSNLFYLPFDENQEHPFIKTVLKYGYPMTAVINCDLLVDSLSSFFDVNLETIVDESKNRKIVPTQSTFSGDGLREEDKQILKNMVKDLPKRLEIIKSHSSVQVPHLFNVTLRIKRVYSAGKFNITNPKFNNSSQQYLLTPSSDSNNFKNTKNHLGKQKSNVKSSIMNPINQNSNLQLLTENLGVNPIKQGSKHPTQSYSLNQGEKPIYTPKAYYVELDYMCHSIDDEVVLELFKNIQKIYGCSIRKNHVNTFEFLYGMSCAICSKSLAYTIYSENNNQNNIEVHREDTLDIVIEKEDDIVQSRKATETNKRIISSPNEEKSPQLNKNVLNLINNNFTLENKHTYDNQYYCPICNIHFCIDCAQSVSDIVNRPSKVHKHFLVYLHKNNKYYCNFVLENNSLNSYSDDFKYFSFNHFQKDLKYNKTHHNTKCDGCKVVPIKNIRWKCCNCVYKNLCDKCYAFGLLEDKSEFSFEVKENLNKLGCDPEEHVFMKIVFDGYFY